MVDKNGFLAYNFIYKLNRLSLKTVTGNKTLGINAKRIGGWCEPMFSLLCITHPRVAHLKRKLEWDANGSVNGRDLIRGRFEECFWHLNLGGTACEHFHSPL